MSSEEITPENTEEIASTPVAKPTREEQETAIEAQGANKKFLLVGITVIGVSVLALIAYWAISAA